MYNSSFCCRRGAPVNWSTAKDATHGPQHRCRSCPAWQNLAKIGNSHCAWPARLSRRFERFSPGLWVIPPRCYWRQAEISEPIHRGSQLFYRFKTGQSSLAFPLALAMYEALKQQQSLGFDCVVPIPLSPDKQERGHFNRTRILANELAALLGVRVADLLSLSAPISKRQFLSAGWTQAEFEYHYHQLLRVDARVTKYARILLLDDVCTQGSTLNCALRRIREAHPHAQLTATTAGQMLLKSVVTDDRLIVGQKPALLFTDLSPET
jgi:predicted amidophosphoribosyltransferase